MSDFNEIIKSEKPTLVDFYADWCGPCRMMNPIIEETKTNLGDKVTILKVNIDNNREISTKYNVRSIPTIILLKNGEIIWRKSGISTAKDLTKEIINLI